MIRESASHGYNTEPIPFPLNDKQDAEKISAGDSKISSYRRRRSSSHPMDSFNSSIGSLKLIPELEVLDTSDDDFSLGAEERLSGDSESSLSYLLLTPPTQNKTKVTLSPPAKTPKKLRHRGTKKSSRDSILVLENSPELIRSQPSTKFQTEPYEYCGESSTSFTTLSSSMSSSISTLQELQELPSEEEEEEKWLSPLKDDLSSNSLFDGDGPFAKSKIPPGLFASDSFLDLSSSSDEGDVDLFEPAGPDDERILECLSNMMKPVYKKSDLIETVSSPLSPARWDSTSSTSEDRNAAQEMHMPMRYASPSRARYTRDVVDQPAMIGSPRPTSKRRNELFAAKSFPSGNVHKLSRRVQATRGRDRLDRWRSPKGKSEARNCSRPSLSLRKSDGGIAITSKGHFEDDSESLSPQSSRL